MAGTFISPSKNRSHLPMGLKKLRAANRSRLVRLMGQRLLRLNPAEHPGASELSLIAAVSVRVRHLPQFLDVVPQFRASGAQPLLRLKSSDRHVTSKIMGRVFAQDTAKLLINKIENRRAEAVRGFCWFRCS
jgi:hypothetical protein